MYIGNSQKSEMVRQIANDLGFLHTGIAEPRFLYEEADHLEEWLKNQYHGEMYYMENWFDKRLDPTLLLPGAKSIICFTYNYFSPTKQNIDSPKISTYAYGEDYHLIIKEKLREMVFRMKEKFGNFNARIFVDSAPVMERAWAKISGIGWTGKHTLLINPKSGSYFFLAVLLTDLSLETDSPFKTDHCGTCTKCMDACPTDAIVKPYLLDASKCISYVTIELKDELIPKEFEGKMENHIFGCDICQAVCPWNRFSIPHHEERFKPDEKVLKMGKGEWQELSEEVFNNLFSKSPIKRTGYKGLKRNLEFITKEMPIKE